MCYSKVASVGFQIPSIQREHDQSSYINVCWSIIWCLMCIAYHLLNSEFFGRVFRNNFCKAVTLLCHYSYPFLHNNLYLSLRGPICILVDIDKHSVAGISCIPLGCKITIYVRYNATRHVFHILFAKNTKSWQHWTITGLCGNRLILLR